ncbi:unnamed protein product [Laminaria digitata]
MPRCKRERFSGSLPLAFLSMPMGGALTVAMTLTALRQSALTATSLRNSPGAMAPRMLLRPRRLCNRGREEDCGYSVGNRFTLRLRRAQAGRRNGRGQEDGVAMQMTALETDQLTVRHSSSNSSSSSRARAKLSVDSRGGKQHSRLYGEWRLRRGLRKLGHVRQPQNVLELLAAAKGRGSLISLRVFNVAIAAVASCEEGWRYALKLLTLMGEDRVAPDRFTLTAIAASCCRCQRWDVAYRVLTEMKRIGLRPLDLRPSRLTTAPGGAGEARDKVLQLLELLRSTDSPEQTRPSTGSAQFGRRDQQSGAVEPREERQAARHLPPSDDTGGYLSDEGGRGDANQRTAAVLGGAVSSAIPNPPLTAGVDEALSPEVDASSADCERSLNDLLAGEIRPGDDVFLSELKAAASAKDSVRALQLLDGMRAAGYRPQPGAYACAIRACGKAGRWEHSLALMDEMRSSGVEPGEGCNVMALKACAAAGRWEKTLEMLRDMRASGVNRSESSFVVAMKACGDAGRWEQALGLMDDMRRDGMPPMETTYTTAMKACGSAGEWKRALYLFDEMRDTGIPPTELCFTAVIKACAKADETEKALSLLQGMRIAQGVRTNMASYRAVMYAYARAGDWASALGLLEDARREELQPSTGDLRTLVQVCGEAEQHERALSLLEEMRSEGMGMRRTGEKLWWVFNACGDKQIKERAWSIMEVEETRERLRLRAERNAQKASPSDNAPQGD